MPQHTQHSLVHILLMWTTLNTIIQVIFITLFFTVGRNELSLNSSTNSSTIEPKHNKQSQRCNASSYPPSAGLLLGKGKMITYKATEATDVNIIHWTAPIPDTVVISDSGEVLQIQMDGFYFLNLQVTLHGTDVSYKQEHTVKLISKDKVLLEGWINPNTNSTGLLSKVQGLSAGADLMVKIYPPSDNINITESVTHMDIIFMEKP